MPSDIGLRLKECVRFIPSTVVVVSLLAVWFAASADTDAEKVKKSISIVILGIVAVLILPGERPRNGAPPPSGGMKG